MNFTFHKNCCPTNDTYRFEGKHYCYFGDVENKENLVVGKVYKHNNDLIVAMFDFPTLALHEWAALVVCPPLNCRWIFS